MKPLKLNLKSGPHHRALIGKHIDVVLEAAAKNGYAVEVFYIGYATSAYPRVLTVRVDEQNIVREAN